VAVIGQIVQAAYVNHLVRTVGLIAIAVLIASAVLIAPAVAALVT